MSQSDVLPDQNDKPNTVFLFGAGASYSAGVPLQSDLLPQIVEQRDPQLAKSETAKRIRNFLTENFSCGDKYPSLEEVFGFINFFISNDLSLTREWTPIELIKVRSNLIKVIHYIISSSPDRNEDFYRFWEQVDQVNRKIGVITTNYDTLIDDSFDKNYPESLIDYCLDFVNYRHPDSGEPFNWWIDPKKPIGFETIDKPTRIKLVKIHGSLNWKYCSTCGQVALTPWQSRYDLKNDGFEAFLDWQVNECPFDGTKLQSLIQPPTHMKVNTNYIFNRLYDEASYLIGNARQLVFVGYSFPEADVHIRALIRRCFSDTGRIVVINKSRAKDLRHRYEGLAKNVEYFEYTFEQFVKSKLFKEILSEGKSLKGTPKFSSRGK